MEFLRAPRDAHPWILDPLIAVGLDMEQIKTLLFRVAFDAVVGARDVESSLRAAVADQPTAVQAAWIETIDRMIAASALAATASRPSGR